MNEQLNSRYQITGMIGTGSTSAVYRALDTLRPDRPEIAIKQYHFDQSFPASEMQYLSLLSHPGIPRVYEAFYGAGCWHVVMDFIDAETLDRCRKDCGGRIPAHEVADIGIQLASILDEVHSHGLLYRDLKPANILRTDTGRIYLIDFGGVTGNDDGNYSGSGRYASPEQQLGLELDGRSDVYSLGVVLFELLFGHCHLEDGRAEEEHKRRLQEALLKMLAWRPEKRLPTMEEVMRELMRV